MAGNPFTSYSAAISAVPWNNGAGQVTGSALQNLYSLETTLLATLGSWTTAGVYQPAIPNGYLTTAMFGSGVLSFANLAGSPTPAQLASFTAPAGTLTGTTIASNVTASSLTSTGTLTAGAIGSGFTINLNAATLLGIIPLVNGGLGSNSPTGARSNIGAAASGANVDITSLGNLSPILDVTFGSTQGQVLARGPSGWGGIASGAAGLVLTANGANALPSYQPPGAAAVTPHSTVRQTVQTGPAAAGAPTFLPATTGTLSITAQNVTASAPLIIAAAQNFLGTIGQVDTVYQFTSNPTWSSLAASNTSYLFVNAATGATSSSTLAPIYQFGGTVATTNGQFTFDILGMVGYLGNGTAAVATPLVCVGQATTSASAVTAAVAYAYNGYFESQPSATIPAQTTPISYNSNLGCPGSATLNLIFTTAANGYAVGDNIENGVLTFDGTYLSPVAISAGPLTASFITSTSGANSLYYHNKTTDALAGAVAGGSGYLLKIRVRRGWGGA